ncbi:MAG: sulfatase-like hydrolase/transferase [Chloracidobacterium sp.]|nr:sulfatase-like hydrolase/transferase [Chloracidobacterium sp.]
MNKVKRIVVTVLAVAAIGLSVHLWLFPSQARTAAAVSKPNIIVILADDLGYGDTSVYGSKTVRTPNIDALAASGVRFTDGYVTHPVCAPSRAGLLTGRYQERFGYEFNGSDRKGGVSLNEIMLPKVMKEAGYATGMVGKWHQGPNGQYYPTERGFDFFWGMSGGGTNYITDPKPGDEFAGVGSDDEINDDPGAKPKKKPGKTLDAGAKLKGKPGKTTIAELSPASADLETLRKQLEAVRTRAPITHNGFLAHETEYLTDAITREALNFIDQNRNHSFFLYVAHHAPHTPLQVTQKYYDRYPDIADKNTRIHAAMVSALDDGVGAIMGKLKATGLDKNTIVFFLSDNGCPGYLRGACSNYPLVGFKRTHFEGGVRIPFIISWPGHAPAGQVDHRTVSSLDIFPTAVAAARGKLPSDRPYDGIDLMPYLTGKRSGAPNPVLYWRAGPTFAIRDHDWKMIVMNIAPPGAKAGNGIKFKTARADDSSSLPPYPATFGQRAMLYNLKNNPAETYNLADLQQPVVLRLKAMLADWNKTLVPPQRPSKTQSYEEYDGVLLHLYD